MYICSTCSPFFTNGVHSPKLCRPLLSKIGNHQKFKWVGYRKLNVLVMQEKNGDKEDWKHGEELGSYCNILGKK